jgi:hypothetical protein
MDPFIEDPALWAGFHSAMPVYIRSALSPHLPEGYFIDIDRGVWIDSDETPEFLGRPDAYVGMFDTSDDDDEGGGVAVTSMAVIAKPTKVVEFEATATRQKALKIIDKSSNKVVTAIELLSPSNKDPHDGRASYLRKRNDYFAAGVNLVELDLLREGERLPMGRPKLAPFDYSALVSIAVQFPRVPLWAWTIRDPFPELPVPLKPRDGFIPMSLKPCLDQAYLDGRYGDRIDYRKKPAGGLTRSDRAWLEKRLPKKKVAKPKR